MAGSWQGYTGWWEVIRNFIDRQIKLLGSLLTVLVVVGFVAAHYFRPVEELLIRENVLSVVLIVLMVMVLDRLVELRPQPRQASVELCAGPAQANAILEDYYAGRRPGKVDLIEYSGVTANDLLSQLREGNCEVRLLLQHPDDARTKFQQDRIRVNVDSLLKVTFATYNRIQIKYYRAPASVRGRCFDDDLVMLGWYRHIAGDTAIAGHSNPMFTALRQTPEGRELIRWFREAFDSLWEHPKTVWVAGQPSDAASDPARRERPQPGLAESEQA